MKSTLMRRLSILLVLALVLAMLPVAAMAADSTTLYLSPNANWKKDGARFAAYFFGNGETWVSMTDADADGVYEVEAPAGYPNVIFCRMKPGTTNNWSNKWNQTADLKVPTDGTSLYTVAEGAWDKGAGAWSVYTPGDEVTEVTTAPLAYSYYVVGSMNSWTCADDALGMSDADGDGIYSVTVALAAGSYTYKINIGNWDKEWSDNGSDFSLSLAEACDVTFTLNPTTGEVTAAGAGEGDAPALDVKAANVKGNFAGLDFDEASEAGAMTLVDGIYTLTIPAVPASAVDAEAYKFKVMVNNSWNTAFPANDWTFYLNAECDVTITYNPVGNVVDIKADGLTYDAPTEGGDTPVDPVEDTWHVKGNVAGLDWDLTTGTGLMTKNEDGSYSLTIADVAAAGKYSVKAVKNSAWEGAAGGMGAGGNYEFSVSAPCAVTFTVSAEGALSVTGDNVGEPVSTELVIESVVIAGNGDGSNSGSGWLNGVQWDPASSVNQLYLKEGSDSVYSVTYYNIAAGTYEFKFAINGSWDISYASGDVVVSGETYTAWASPLGNSSFTVDKDGSTVTFVLDMTNVVYATDNASMSITIEAPADAGESSAPETLVIGGNDFVIASGDRNPVTSTFTATADGVLNIFPTAMKADPFGMGILEEVPAENLGMQFGRNYSILVDGVPMWLPISIEVTAGQVVEIGVQHPWGSAAEITLTLCDNHNVAYSYDKATCTHTIGCAACGYGTSTVGGNEFKINSAYLTLASDVSVIFRATIPAGFENAYMVFNVNGVEYTAYSMGQDAQGRDLFSYPGINPQMMGDNIHAVLYASVNGIEVSPIKAVDYSVLTYCNKQLPTAGKNFKTLISDLLVYGAASQTKMGYKTDALVTDLATTALTPSTFPGTSAITNKQAAVGDKNPLADVTGVGLNLSNQVVCKFGFTITDEDPYKYIIKVQIGEKVEEFSMYETYEDGGKYWLNYCNYSASQFDETITVTLWDGETQMGRTFTYSVNSYFYKNANSSDAGLATLVQAVYNYGVSAANYVANPNG